MASLIIAAGALTYDKVKSTRAKRLAAKESAAARFSELEKENAERISRLHSIPDPPPSSSSSPPFSAPPTTNTHSNTHTHASLPSREIQTPRTSTDPFRDSADQWEKGKGRGSGGSFREGREAGVVVAREGGGGERKSSGEEEVPPPPEYESLIADGGEKKRKKKGRSGGGLTGRMFGGGRRAKGEGTGEDGFVR
ncbi:hypothetical protein MMC06_005324 [Schaereria dolodes]|nr:hypothetical protein [Schaereria dolodes]